MNRQFLGLLAQNPSSSYYGTMKYSIRDATEADLPDILTLNEAVVPHVNSLGIADMQKFLAKAVYFRVADNRDGEIVAFLIGLDPDISYKSPNFQWFCTHYGEFAYIDRIAVDPAARRQGVAEALYADFANQNAHWARRLCCEVNLRPANPGSFAFHTRIGFAQVGELDIYDGEQTVALLVKELP
jgi:predicted GNAT superfamily acetyltransferase